MKISDEVKQSIFWGAILIISIILISDCSKTIYSPEYNCPEKVKDKKEN